MEDDAYFEMMNFVKSPEFIDMDFIMGSEWSEQYSPDHSVFSSPGQNPQLDLVNSLPDENIQLLLPTSAFAIDSPNYYVSNHFTLPKKAYG